jgi:hypothetical protein
MSFKVKTIAFSAAGLLAAAGGIYAFMPDNQESASGSREIVGSVQTVAPADLINLPSTTDKRVGEQGVAQGTDTTAATKQSAKDQPESQAPKKLTRQQLLPPPATEDEKLQKAAEQESHF